jgi:hypothetical protein
VRLTPAKEIKRWSDRRVVLFVSTKLWK